MTKLPLPFIPIFYLSAFITFFSLVLPGAIAAPSLSGKELYQARCMECHGMDAKGSLKAARRLKVDPAKLDLTVDSVLQKPASELKKLIAGGHGRMPKQGGTLRTAQIRAIIKYLQTLQTSIVSNRPSRPN